MNRDPKLHPKAASSGEESLKGEVTLCSRATRVVGKSSSPQIFPLPNLVRRRWLRSALDAASYRGWHLPSVPRRHSGHVLRPAMLLYSIFKRGLHAVHIRNRFRNLFASISSFGQYIRWHGVLFPHLGVTWLLALRYDAPPPY